MKLYFKVGTGPGVYMKVTRKRKIPVVGERFCIKDPQQKYSREISVRLTEIKDLRTHLMYVVELF